MHDINVHMDKPSLIWVWKLFPGCLLGVFSWPSHHQENPSIPGKRLGPLSWYKMKIFPICCPLRNGMPPQCGVVSMLIEGGLHMMPSHCQTITFPPSCFTYSVRKQSVIVVFFFSGGIQSFRVNCLYVLVLCNPSFYYEHSRDFILAILPMKPADLSLPHLHCSTERKHIGSLLFSQWCSHWKSSEISASQEGHS